MIPWVLFLQICLLAILFYMIVHSIVTSYIKEEVMQTSLAEYQRSRNWPQFRKVDQESE